MVTFCMNDLCIYWKDKNCTLDNISLNEMGICNEYISVEIPQEELENYRKNHLEDLRAREAECPVFKVSRIYEGGTV